MPSHLHAGPSSCDHWQQRCRESNSVSGVPGPDGRGFRRLSDAADNTAFVVCVGGSFDKAAVKRMPGNHLVLATNTDGSCKKPCVTLQQLAAVSFKVRP